MIHHAHHEHHDNFDQPDHHTNHHDRDPARRWSCEPVLMYLNHHDASCSPCSSWCHHDQPDHQNHFQYVDHHHDHHNQDPARRWSCEQLLMHQFFKSFSFKLPESEEEVCSIHDDHDARDNYDADFKTIMIFTLKTIFPQLSRRNGNSGGMLLPHLPQVPKKTSWNICLHSQIQTFTTGSKKDILTY